MKEVIMSKTVRFERYDDDGSVDFRYFLNRKKSRRKLVKKMKLNHLRKRIEEMKWSYLHLKDVA
jgi:hypothetical protein|tara:strand:- start:67 stop:258 length:192 start_codon:yes stop_codon:yes gene_type:complete